MCGTSEPSPFFKDDPQYLEGLTTQEAKEFVHISRPEVEDYKEAKSEGTLQDLARQAIQLLNISDVELGTSSGGEDTSRAIAEKAISEELAEEAISEEEIPSALTHGEKDITLDPLYPLTPPETPYKPLLSSVTGDSYNLKARQATQGLNATSAK
ncbi:hypothetical protein PWT90_07776 [Aphanocladium album]|nr:hypothetical protein PWT90_07776 [Aphanocladium album]